MNEYDQCHSDLTFCEVHGVCDRCNPRPKPPASAEEVARKWFPEQWRYPKGKPVDYNAYGYHRCVKAITEATAELEAENQDLRYQLGVERKLAERLEAAEAELPRLYALLGYGACSSAIADRNLRADAAEAECERLHQQLADDRQSIARERQSVARIWGEQVTNLTAQLAAQKRERNAQILELTVQLAAAQEK